MQTKVKTNTLTIFQLALIRESFHCGCPLFDMEEAHFQALVRKTPSLASFDQVC